MNGFLVRNAALYASVHMLLLLVEFKDSRV